MGPDDAPVTVKPIVFTETTRPGLEEREFPAPQPLPSKPVVFGDGGAVAAPAPPPEPIQTMDDLGIGALTPYPSKED